MATLPTGIFAQVGAPISTPGVGTATPIASASDGSGDSSGWLSGLGDLFQGVAAGIATGIRASNMPTGVSPGSGWVYNSQTGQYYNPVTGQALTSTGTLPSAGGLSSLLGGSSLVLVLLFAVAFLAFRKKP